MSYAPALDPLALAEHPDRGRISVYAQGGDYHDVVKRALKGVARWLVGEAKDAEVKVFVDTAPVMEKPLSAAAEQKRVSRTPPSRHVSSNLANSSEDSRSEEHTSELQSLMRISYAVFCLKQNITKQHRTV